MKKLLAEWPQINWNLKLNQMHDTTRNRAQNKWSMSCAQLNFMGRPHGGKLGRPNHFLVARIILVYLKKKSCFLIMNTKLHRNVLTCSDAHLYYVEFKYTRYSEAFIENVKSPGSWTAKFGGRAGKRNQETKWIRVNTGTVKRTGDTAVLH